MNPADIPFWGWMVISVLCGIVFLFTVAGNDSKKGLGVMGFGVLAAFAGIVCFFIGLIRFVKWIWA